MDISQLSHQDIERMRAIVLASDKQAGKVKEFDLNNPPTPPYRYQPFPKTLYREGANRIVRDEREMQLALEAGWQKSAAGPVEVISAAVELDAQTIAEAAEIDARIAANKRARLEKR